MQDRHVWRPLQLASAVAGVALVVFFLVLGLVNWYFPTKLSSTSDDPAYVWASMILATSSPSWEWFRCHYDPLAFSLSLTAHILLNVGTFFGMVWFAMDAALKRGNLMDLQNAVNLRDTLIKNFILRTVVRQVPAEAKAGLSKSFDDAIEQAGQEWQRQITIVMGESAAEKVASLMTHPV